MKKIKFTILALMIIAISSSSYAVSDYDIQLDNTSLGAYVEAYGEYGHNLGPTDVHESTSDGEDYWTPGSYLWETPLEVSTYQSSDNYAPFYDHAVSSLETSDSYIGLFCRGAASAKVNGMGSTNYFGVEGYATAEISGEFSIAKNVAALPDTVSTSFNLNIDGGQEAGGDFASWASAFFGIYSGDTLLGSYAFGDIPYGWHNYNGHRVRNDDFSLSENPLVNVDLLVGETYSFNMWLLTDAYGSENYPWWTNGSAYWGTNPHQSWESYDGFTDDGVVYGFAESFYSTSFELESIDLEGRENVIPEPATMVLFGLGSLGLGLVRKRRSLSSE